MTCCEYIVAAPGEVVAALHSVGRPGAGANNGKAGKGGKAGGTSWSNREWPVSGGVDSSKGGSCFQEMLVTGHADGSVRFWDATGTNMQHLYRYYTSDYNHRSLNLSGGPFHQFGGVNRF